MYQLYLNSMKIYCIDSSLSWHGSHFQVCINFVFVRCETVTVSPNQIIIIIFNIIQNFIFSDVADSLLFSIYS